MESDLPSLIYQTRWITAVVDIWFTCYSW